MTKTFFPKYLIEVSLPIHDTKSMSVKDSFESPLGKNFNYLFLFIMFSTSNIVFLSHNNPCFPCNIAITNFLILYTCEIRFYDVIVRTVRTFTS